jgi:hypothetical protein
MVDVKTQIASRPQDPPAEHMRNKRRHRRLQILKAVRDERKGVRVVPTDDKLRGVLKHPNGTGFRAKGGIVWPDDNFTQRRLRDGSVKIEAKEKPEAKADATISKAEATNLSGRPRSQTPA